MNSLRQDPLLIVDIDNTILDQVPRKLYLAEKQGLDIDIDLSL